MADQLLSEALHLVRELVRVRAGDEAVAADSEPVGARGLLLALRDLLLVHARHSVVVVLDVAHRGVVVLAAALADDLEAADLWLVVVDFGRQDHRLLIVLQEVVGEGGPEEGAVDVHLTELGNVDLFTARAVDFDARDLGPVVQAHRQHLLAVAQGSGASAVEALEELLVDLSHAVGGVDVARVDEPVEVAGLLVELEELLVGKVLLVRALGRKDHS
mmetsp:Transcript_13273/g.22524  ORF Transcript_13273/g.22524 Transcript_13273/m.22524 type:complete len:217 (-) Transcript_13273:279-929(-)